MMETSPAAPFVVAKPDLLLEVLVDVDQFPLAREIFHTRATRARP